MVIKTLLSSTDPITEQEAGAVLMRRMKDSQKTCLTKLAQNTIQLQSKRTGAVLRRTKDSQETCLTKIAQNTIQY